MIQVLAEACCNHMGSMALAKEMIDVAASYCKAPIIKFQKRCNKELLTEEEYNAPHPNEQHAFGPTYGLHREFLEFTLEQHADLKKYCESRGIVYSTSVWELTSAKEIASLEPELIKIPSACNTDLVMLKWLAENYKGKIHISLGMTELEEEKIVLELFGHYNRLKDIVLYHCTSGYPVDFQDVCLLEIKRLIELYGHVVDSIGFSGHHLGIAVDMCAVALGAKYIERHFTLNRCNKGTDNAASLEPGGMFKLVRDVKAAQLAMSYKPHRMLDVEVVQRKKLKRFRHEI